MPVLVGAIMTAIPKLVNVAALCAFIFLVFGIVRPARAIDRAHTPDEISRRPRTPDETSKPPRAHRRD
eukprot:4911350-Prymnesium_polylepis.1